MISQISQARISGSGCIIRPLPFGGRETTLRYATADGLELVLVVRSFTASPILRFQYRLSTGRPVAFTKPTGPETIRYFTLTQPGLDAWGLPAGDQVRSTGPLRALPDPLPDGSAAALAGELGCVPGVGWERLVGDLPALSEEDFAYLGGQMDLYKRAADGITRAAPRVRLRRLQPRNL